MTEDGDERVIVTARISGLRTPHVPSSEARCRDCGAATWLSHATMADALPGDTIVCQVCAMLRAAREDEPPEIVVGPETAREVQRWKEEHR